MNRGQRTIAALLGAVGVLLALNLRCELIGRGWSPEEVDARSLGQTLFDLLSTGTDAKTVVTP